ncbi:MAG: hypothetical protein ACR2I1_07520 [Propionibacteriaceae bacterium]
MAQAQARIEAKEAQKLIDAFLVDVARAGIVPTQLTATLLGGAKVKTDKQGWYLRKNRSLAIGTDGGYYVLTAPGGWRERIRGVTLEPTLPVLVIGRGGRDGETGELAEFLQWILERDA